MSAEQPGTSQCLSTVWTEIHFTVPVWAGEKGIHSFPPLSRRNVVFLNHQGHQLPNEAGKIKRCCTKSPLPNPGRSLDMDAARDGCAWSKNNVCLPGVKGFCNQLKKVGRVPDSHLQNELTLSSQCNFVSFNSFLSRYSISFVLEILHRHGIYSKSHHLAAARFLA